MTDHQPEDEEGAEDEGAGAPEEADELDDDDFVADELPPQLSGKRLDARQRGVGWMEAGGKWKQAFLELGREADAEPCLHLYLEDDGEAQRFDHRSATPQEEEPRRGKWPLLLAWEHGDPQTLALAFNTKLERESWMQALGFRRT
eukprot:tig00020553_g10666.t1